MTQNKAASVTLDNTALASFPKPALVIDGEGRVLAANQAAGAICEAMGQGQIPGISAAVGRALTVRRSQSDVVMVPGLLGPMLYDINVLPNTAGSALVLAKDVTLESNLRATLVESRQRYKDLVDISTDFAWELGDDGRFVFVSPRGALGYTADQLVGHYPADFLLEQGDGDNLLPFVSAGPVEEAEVWMRRPDGTAACLLASSAPLLDADGRRRGARGVCREVTKERERDAALARANNRERLLNYIVRTIRDVVDPADILGIAAEATARALGAAGCQIFRHEASQFIPAATFGKVSVASSVLALLASADTHEGVVEDRQILGSVTRHHHDINGSIILWREVDDLPWGEDEREMLDDVANQIGIANEQIANHERILLLSRTDALTGLFNRRAFFEELARRFSRLARDRRPAALIYVDLDNFKLVNDVHGHKRGDEALMAVREILITHSRPIDLVARLGGDEFAIWLEGSDEEIAVRRCAAMIKASTRLLEYSGKPEAQLTMSMGVAVHDPAQPELLHDLLSRADGAMYAVKREGKGSFRLAKPAIAEQDKGG